MAATSNSATGVVILAVLGGLCWLLGPPWESFGFVLWLAAAILFVTRLAGIASGTDKDRPPG